MKISTPKRVKCGLIITGIVTAIGLLIFLFYNPQRYTPDFISFPQFVWAEHFFTFFIGTLFLFFLVYIFIFKISSKDYREVLLVILFILLFLAGCGLAHQSLTDELNDISRSLDTKCDSKIQFILDINGCIFAFLVIFIFYFQELKLLTRP